MTIEIDKTLGTILSVIGIISALVTALFWAYNLGRKHADNDFKRVSRENKYRLIYAPLRKLLINKHITTAIAVRYPFFKQRLKRAFPYLKKFKLKEGLRTLNDQYGGKPSTEIEFGGDFPLETMKEILNDNIAWADSRLVDLIQRADRSRYEEQFDSNENTRRYSTELTDSELEIIDYIFETFDKLNKKLITSNH